MTQDKKQTVDEVTQLRQQLADMQARYTEQERALGQLYEQVEQLETLQRVDDELLHELDSNYVISMALDLNMRLSQADAGFIGLIEDGGHVKVMQAIGEYPRSLESHLFAPGAGIIGRTIRQRESELVVDVASDPDYIATIADMRAQITIPLLSFDHPVGVLCLETRKPEHFSQQRFEFLKLITSRVASVVDNAQLHQAVRDQLAELQTLYDQVSNLEQLKTNMIRMAAHDLRNPLTRIWNALKLLRLGLADQIREDQDEYLDVIMRATEQMNLITNDILSLQRIEQAAQGDFTQDVDLPQVIKQVFKNHQRQAEQQKQDYDLHLPEVALRVKGDQAQLREAITNLIGNAIKYTPEGGRIVVRLGQEETAIVFEVEDNGFGIPEDKQERLFQPFSRIITTETEMIEGTGLGLHLVKTIIEYHKGKMKFQSTYGKGSTFGFRLPMAN